MNNISEHTIEEVVAAKYILKKEIEDLLNKFYGEYKTPLDGCFSIVENCSFGDCSSIPIDKHSVINCEIKM